MGDATEDSFRGMEDDPERFDVAVVTQANILTITDQKTYTEAGAVLVAIKDAMKRVSAYWDEPVKKARASWEALTKRRSEMLKPMEAAETNLKRQMAQFHAKLEEMRLAEEQKVREALEKQAKADREALARENEELGSPEQAAVVRQAPVAIPSVVLPPVQQVDRVKYREDWKAEVVDPLAVPREYLLIDEKKLAMVARALKADANVAGVRFFKVQVVVAGR